MVAGINFVFQNAIQHNRGGFGALRARIHGRHPGEKSCRFQEWRSCLSAGVETREFRVEWRKQQRMTICHRNSINVHE
jgi:hypothetical protein